MVRVGQDIRLEPAHLTRRSGAACPRSSAYEKAHGGIDTEPLGVVGVFIAGKTTENGLAQ